jgi:hypothetical protein
LCACRRGHRKEASGSSNRQHVAARDQFHGVLPWIYLRGTDYLFAGLRRRPLQTETMIRYLQSHSIFKSLKNDFADVAALGSVLRESVADEPQALDNQLK